MRESTNDPESNESPPTEPRGELVPPPDKPPTSIGAPAEPPLPPKPLRFMGDWRGRSTFARLANEILDAVDAFADRVASELRLR